MCMFRVSSNEMFRVEVLLSELSQFCSCMKDDGRVFFEAFWFGCHLTHLMLQYFLSIYTRGVSASNEDYMSN